MTLFCYTCSHQITSVQYSNTGDTFLVTSGSAQVSTMHDTQDMKRRKFSSNIVLKQKQFFTIFTIFIHNFQ